MDQKLNRLLTSLMALALLLSLFGNPTQASAAAPDTSVQQAGYYNVAGGDKTDECATAVDPVKCKEDKEKKDKEPKVAPSGWTQGGADWKVVVDNTVTNPSNDTRVVASSSATPSAP